MNFQAALPVILRNEGGYSNDPQDPGGATNYGITQKTYNDYRTSRVLSKENVKNITPAEVSSIYEMNYWKPAYCDSIPADLRLIHFDNAVNCGVGTANLMLQDAAGVKMDGVIGIITLTQLQIQPFIYTKYIARRMSKYTSIVAHSPVMLKFLPSWINRIRLIIDLTFI